MEHWWNKKNWVQSLHFTECWLLEVENYQYPKSKVSAYSEDVADIIFLMKHTRWQATFRAFGGGRYSPDRPCITWLSPLEKLFELPEAVKHAPSGTKLGMLEQHIRFTVKNFLRQSDMSEVQQQAAKTIIMLIGIALLQLSTQLTLTGPELENPIKLSDTEDIETWLDTDLMLKKNLANKIFGLLARCDF